MQHLSFGELVALALCTAIFTSVCTTTLTLGLQFVIAKIQRTNEQLKHIREKLHDRYAEFVLLATCEIDRARTIIATIATGVRNNDFTDAARIDDARHQARLGLARLSFQIRLLEQTPILVEYVIYLARNQPFMTFPFPPQLENIGYQQRRDKFVNDVTTYENTLSLLVDNVLRIHASPQPVFSLPKVANPTTQ